VTWPSIVLPEWPPHDWRAWAALISGIAGGAALTVFAVWVVWILAFSGEWSAATEARRVELLGHALILLLVGVIAVLLAQGLAINRRKISIGRGGIMIEGGGGPAAAAIDKAAKAAGAMPEEGEGNSYG
jgi:hypothetical protein